MNPPMSHRTSASEIAISGHRDGSALIEGIQTDGTGVNSQSLIQTSLRYRVSSAVLAFVIWGGWAYVVNQRSVGMGDAPPFASALIHGSASCLITLFILQAVTRLFHRLHGHPLRLILPAIITTLFTGTVASAVHLLIGTANVPLTVLPGVTVAFCFNLLTTKKLQVQETA